MTTKTSTFLALLVGTTIGAGLFHIAGECFGALIAKHEERVRDFGCPSFYRDRGDITTQGRYFHNACFEYGPMGVIYIYWINPDDSDDKHEFKANGYLIEHEIER